MWIIDIEKDLYMKWLLFHIQWYHDSSHQVCIAQGYVY